MKPADAPQRADGSFGRRGRLGGSSGTWSRPEGLPERPADSWGRPRSEKPADAPQRPAGSYGRRGKRSN